MTDDAALLRRYLDGSEAAFAELVRCHIDAVYGTALRMVGGDAHLAKDVTQKVFTGLARKASSLANRGMLVGWLYLSTHYEAAATVRAERRWHDREQKAQAMQEIENQGAPEPDWSALRPVLDSAMRDLKDGDRDALLLRFFQSHTLAEVGEALGLSENAARMRVDRALDKLHGLLARRGIKSTATALGTVLADQLATAAPVTLASTVTSVALAGAASTTGATLVFMGMTKIQIGVAAALVVAGGSTLWSERQTESKLRAENSALAEQTAQISDLKTENNRLEAAAQRAEILRNQEVELGRLRFEAERLQQEIGKTVMARSAQLAGNRPTKPSQPRPPQLTVDGQPIYPLSQLDERPSPTVQVEAAYPADLKVAGVEGKVLVSLVINPDGLVRELKVEQATNEVFAEAAKQALEKWKFKPAIKDGVPVNSRVSVPFQFSLKKQGAADWF